MPLLRCLGIDCQHEYESYDDNPICDWCGSKSFYILQDKTPLEIMCEGDIIANILKGMVKSNERREVVRKSNR